MEEPIAVVTGAGRGLGRAVAEALARAGRTVVVAARREAAAREVVDGLRARGLRAEPLRLDVADPASIAAAAAGLAGRRVGALVNNAGVYEAHLDAATARASVETNALGPLRLTEAVAPLLAPGAAVVMVSSGMGELSGLPPGLRRRVEAAGTDRAALADLGRAFVDEVAAGRHPASAYLAYRVSKALLNGLARAFALALPSARVNAVCPGWVRTDMGGPSATRSVEEGARGIVWAALLPPGGPTGGFFRDGEAIPW